MALQNLRSSTPSKRPDASSMSDGQIALNTAAASAGLFFKDSNGDLVKTGPVHIGTTAPNSTPATGGSTGNSKGEAWLDTSNGNYVLKIYDGTAWRSVEIAAGSARQLLQTNAAGTDVEFTSNVDVPGTLDVTGATTLDSTASVAGLLSANGKVSFTAGTEALPAIYSGSDTNTGIYSPGADQFAISTAGTSRLYIDSSGNVGIGTSTDLDQRLCVQGTSNDTIDETTGTAKFEASGGNGLLFGTKASSPYSSYIQSAYVQDTSTARYSLLLNPIGGNVGIGTSDPQSGLHVHGSDQSSAAIQDAGNMGGFLKVTGTGSVANSGGGVLFGNQQSLNAGSAGFAGIKGLLTNGTSNTIGDLGFYVRNGVTDSGLTERMRMTSSGNVGIGTSTPSTFAGDCTLALSDTGGSRLGFEATGRNYYIAGDSGSDRLEIGRRITGNTGDSPGIVLNGSGNVGIGTSSPASRLHLEVSSITNNTSQDIITLNDGGIGGAGITLDRYQNAQNYGLSFFTTAGTSAEKVRITNSGNVGIGTTSPTRNLVVNDSTGNAWVSARSSDTGFAGLLMGDQTSDATGQISYSNNTDSMQIIVAGSEKMRIDQGGKVGIGTSSPGAKLHLLNSGQATPALNTAGDLSLLVSESGTSVNNGGSVVFGAASGSWRFAAIKGLVQNGANNTQGDIAFLTRAASTDTTLTERMRIVSSGNVGIGTGNPQVTFHVVGAARISNLGGSANADVNCSTAGTLFRSTSDGTLKENVATLGSQIENVKALSPVSYNWIDTEFYGEQTEIGFIAQEVQPLIPEIVTTNSEDKLGLNYSRLTVTLTKALQEAIAKIETLEQRLDDAGL